MQIHGSNCTHLLIDITYNWEYMHLMSYLCYLPEVVVAVPELESAPEYLLKF